MLFIQLKSLTYCILASIVACQINPGIYTIRSSLVDSGFLAASSQNPDGVVIGRSLAPGPDRLALWDISVLSPDQGTIKNFGTNTYLSDEGNNAILANNPIPLFIERQGDGSITISINTDSLFLSLIPGPDPHLVTFTQNLGPNTNWIFTPIP